MVYGTGGNEVRKLGCRSVERSAGGMGAGIGGLWIWEFRSGSGAFETGSGSRGLVIGVRVVAWGGGSSGSTSGSYYFYMLCTLWSCFIRGSASVVLKGLYSSVGLKKSKAIVSSWREKVQL